MLWLEHVARMPITAPQKQTLFSWLAKQHYPFKQAQWLNACLHDARIPEIDWFRLAQDKVAWQNLIFQAYPTKQVLLEKRKRSERMEIRRSNSSMLMKSNAHLRTVMTSWMKDVGGLM